MFVVHINFIELVIKILPIQAGLLLNLTYIYISTARADLGRNFVTKEMISIFPMWFIRL